MSVNKQEKYEQPEDIHLWYDKGLLSLVIGSKVMRNIEQHETEKMKGKVHGLIFGEIKTNDIIIQESIKLSNKACADSIIESIKLNKIASADSIGKNYQLMGYYSYGKIPSENDVEFLHSASKNLLRSLFLIKYECSDGSKVNIYESVPDIRAGIHILLLIQTSRKPFVELINDYNNYDDSKNLIRYLFPEGEGAIIRFKLYLDEDEKLRLKEKPILEVSEVEKRKRKEFFKNLKGFLKQDKTADDVTLLSNACEKAKAEPISIFQIPIDDKERKECEVYLSYIKPSYFFCSSSLTIQGAQQMAADCAISTLLEDPDFENEEDYF